MKLDKSHTFKSRYHNIKLVATEFVELHYGNTMWKFKFYINDKQIENEYLDNSAGGLYPNRDKFELESPDGEYIYIPNEKNTLLDIPKNMFYILNDDSNSLVPGHVFVTPDPLVRFPVFRSYQ